MALDLSVFANLLRRLRAQKNLQRSVLAKKSGVSYESIRRYEESINRPERDMITKLATILGMEHLKEMLEAADYTTEDVAEVDRPVIDAEFREVMEIYTSMNEDGRARFKRMMRDAVGMYAAGSLESVSGDPEIVSHISRIIQAFITLPKEELLRAVMEVEEKFSREHRRIHPPDVPISTPRIVGP